VVMGVGLATAVALWIYDRIVGAGREPELSSPGSAK
jgi:hypothetical protein